MIKSYNSLAIRNQRRGSFIVVLLLILFPVMQLHAQGTCERPQASAYLDAGNVRAHLGIGGMPVLPRQKAYEVPKGDGVLGLSCMFTWFGGIVAGEARVANGWQLWPGPLDAQGLAPDDCTPYDRIFELKRGDLESYNRTGAVSANLQNWPWQWGAPVLDGDGDPDNYNLNGGDRPALVGHQMLWWVMNDAGGPHASGPESQPVGMEIQVSAYAYDVPGAVGNTTFFRYKFIYKGRETLEDAYFGLIPEANLGYSYDNFAGADTTLHLVYFYDDDNMDGYSGRDGVYGENPPAMGFTFLPPATDLLGKDTGGNDFNGLAAFVPYGRRYPREAKDYYNRMRGFWTDTEPVTYGGNGWDYSETPAPIFYPGDPITGGFWSEMNIDGQGTKGPATYEEALISTGPFTLETGQAHEVTFAIAWSRGADNLDSIRKLKQDVAHLHRFSASLTLPDPSLLGATAPQAPEPDLAFAQNYPNPFSGQTTIRYSLPKPMRVRLTVFDVLGREVATLVDAQQEADVYAVPFEAEALPAGLYFYRIQMDHLSATRSMLLLR